MGVSMNLSNKFIDELVVPNSPGLNEIIDWIELNLDLEEVYPTKRLETWAFDNGFRKFE